ncbi:class I lanthipeptide [Taibaiella helva]|uniref:class I lanthipeptide n=1 Tax=Taibaiella helva TaxID=2301235 RepID=UPI0013004AC4|nr:class I lanthipeptide [Taibaiella helva]
MKKAHLNFSRKLKLNKETIALLSARQAQFIGGAPITVGCPPATVNCPPATLNCPILTDGCQTISICNDQCAVTWGCPPETSNCPISDSCNCPTG